MATEIRPWDEVWDDLVEHAVERAGSKKAVAKAAGFKPTKFVEFSTNPFGLGHASLGKIGTLAGFTAAEQEAAEFSWMVARSLSGNWRDVLRLHWQRVEAMRPTEGRKFLRECLRVYLRRVEEKASRRSSGE